MQINPIGQFRDAILAAGLIPPADIEADLAAEAAST